MSNLGTFILIALLAAISGCSRDAGGANDATPSRGAQAGAIAQAPAALPVDTLQARAQAAVAAQRYYAPAGDSAIDYYLALRDLSPDARGVDAALTELQPYLLIASEQALARSDLDEAKRLLALLARVDATAPALPRLREGLRMVELANQAKERAVAAAATDAARMATLAGFREAEAKPGKSAPVVEVASAARPLPPAAEPVVPRAVPAVVVAAPVVPLPAAPRALPRLVSDAAPRYPLIALNRRIEGSVQVSFTIQPDGRVAGVRLVSSTPADIFDAAALAAVGRWRFEATGQSTTTQRTLDFRLPKG